MSGLPISVSPPPVSSIPLFFLSPRHGSSSSDGSRSDVAVRAAAQVPPPQSDSPQAFTRKLALGIPVTAVINMCHNLFLPPCITASLEHPQSLIIALLIKSRCFSTM